MKKNWLWFVLLLMFLGGSILLIFDRWGNVSTKTDNIPTDNNVPTPNTAITTLPNTPHQDLPQTCADKETVKTGYKLFRSDVYKYCIQYPTSWPADSADPAIVTFGTVNPEPTEGWFRVKYFSGKSASARTSEIKADFREPSGPCTPSDVMIAGEKAKKFDCSGAFNNETHVFYLVTEGSNLIELSYIDGMGANKPPYDALYKVMVENFLSDVSLNK